MMMTSDQAGNGKKSRIYVECTQTYTEPRVKTGIQRVVRNIVKNSEKVVFENTEIIPVAIRRGQFYKVPTFDLQLDKNIYQKKEIIKPETRVSLTKMVFRSAYFVLRKLKLVKLVKTIVGRDSDMLMTAKQNLSLSYDPVDQYPLGDKIEFKKSDILVLLDSSWNFNTTKILESLPEGVVKVAVIYDLIPLSHGSFFDESLVMFFKKWLSSVAKGCDGFLCISKTVASNMTSYLDKNQVSSNVDYFYLGSDLDRAVNDGGANSSAALKMFDKKDKNFLVVGTLEPRKNVTFVIDAFDRLIATQKDTNVKVWLVGKVGWKVEDLYSRITNHPYFGKNLFLLDHASDEDLNFLYQNSSALIQASIEEGFGLPLVEALQKGLPVLASDIPVFREVLGDCNSARFFSLSNPADLAGYLAGEIPEKPQNFKWMNWMESTQSFFERLQKFQSISR